MLKVKNMPGKVFGLNGLFGYDDLTTAGQLFVNCLMNS